MIELDANEARVLGSLVEKSLTTPELYPLTFNALLNACNQKTSREPVMTLDVDTMGKAAQTLIAKELAERLQFAGDRVPKFKHFIDKLTGSVDERVNGLVCVLLLRGPQTAGELKARTDRLCKFESAAEVEGLLQELSAKEGAFISRVPRQPGQKEGRYRELFTGGSPTPSAPPPVYREGAGGRAVLVPDDRLALLEKRVEILEGLINNLIKPDAKTEV